AVRFLRLGGRGGGEFALRGSATFSLVAGALGHGRRVGGLGGVTLRIATLRECLSGGGSLLGSGSFGRLAFSLRRFGDLLCAAPCLVSGGSLRELSRGELLRRGARLERGRGLPGPLPGRFMRGLL